MPEKITDKTEVSATELAAVLGLTARRVQQMAQDGTLPTVRRGHYLVCESVQRYVGFLLKNKRGSTLDEEKEQAEADIKKAKAIIAGMEAEEMQGKMHRSEDVADMTEDLIYEIRGMLVALPGRLAVDVAAAAGAAEASEIIRREVYALMEDMSRYRYDPRKYAERVRERRKWDIEDQRDGEGE